MKRILFLISTVLITLTSFAQDTYLHCGKLLDVTSGKYLKDQTVIITGNKVTAVEKGFKTPSGDKIRVIDLKTKTVLPGLIDLHVHIEGESSPTTYLDEFRLNEADVAFRAQEIASRTLRT